MKKIITILIALTASILCLSAANQGTITKTYDYKGFSTIDIGNFFEVTVEKSKDYKVDVIVSKEYEDYLDVTVKNGILSIAFKKLPAKLTAASIGKIANAHICLPEMSGVNLSGAAKLNCNDSFDLGRGVFNMSIEGASSVNGLEVNATEARIYGSGAAKAEMKGSFASVYFTLSGTSRIDADLSADDLIVKASGTSVLDVTGEFEDVNLDASGVANITVSGEGDELVARTSGTASVDASSMVVMGAEVSLAGASVTKVNVVKNLEISAQGASRCIYKDIKGLKITEKGTSRAATIKPE